MAASMAKSKAGQCVFCGKQGRVTREHVVPRGLFLSPLPETMITVPVCQPCNNGKSSDDTYLRDFLLSDMASRPNRVAQALRKGKLMRAVQTNRSELARTIARHARRKPLYSTGGIYLGSFYCVSVEERRLESSFQKMARGLYYYVSKQYLPQDAQVEVSRVDRFQIRAAWDAMGIQHAGTDYIHPDVFACRHYADAEFPLYSRWLLLFYNTILFEVLTLPSTWVETVITADQPASTSILTVPTSGTGTGVVAP